jgi:hypothetical protein
MKGINMKHFFSVTFLTVLVVLFLAGCALNSFPPAVSSKTGAAAGKTNIPDSKEWEHLGKTRTGDCYFKVNGTDNATGIVTVSTYKIVNDDHRKSTIEKLKKIHPAQSEKYETLDHSIRVDEIDCQNKRYRMKEVVDYDNEGLVLCVNPSNNHEWHHIPILTGLDKMRLKLCAPEVKPAEPTKPAARKKLFKKKK